jgi:TRAP-type C4-dicarboxylate transport system substrate-binding protein
MKTRMKTRWLLFLAASIVLISLALVSYEPKASTAGPNVYVVKVNVLFHQTHPFSIITAKKIKDIEARSGGRLKFEMFYGGSLTPLREALGGLQRGAYEGMVGVLGWWAGMDARFNIAAGCPFLARDTDDYDNLIRTTDLSKMIDRACGRFNTVRVGWDVLDGYQILTKIKPVRKLEDMQGLKIRAGGIADKLALKKLGAIPVDVVTAEIYPALEKGVIDGAILNESSTTAYKLEELIRYVTQINLIPGIMGNLLFNQDFWKGLPTDLQTSVVKTYDDWDRRTRKYWEAEIIKSIDIIKARGVEFIKVDEEERQRWVKIGGLPIWEWTADKISGADGETFLKIAKEHSGLK